MRIACSRCQTQYDLPDERLEGGAAKIRCSRCGHVFVVKRRSSEPPPPSPPPPQEEARFDDFDFGSFGEPRPGSSELRQEPGPQPLREADKEEGFLSSSDELPALGELDLGEFDAGGGGLAIEESLAARREPEPEDVEQIRPDDLVSRPSRREVPLQGIAEEIPRLDLQKGPRRAETAGKPSPVLARDRRRSPMFWVVLAAVLATGAYTGYNAYRHPEALTFLNPIRIRELWQSRDDEARFSTEDVKGYAQDLPGGRRIFVIRGRVANNSGRAQGLIRVKGSLFAPDGATVATSEVYCGNVLTERELAVLPRATIEARLQNQVGEALSNVDIAPGGKVPFMLVFTSPPARVEKFNVGVSASRPGGGS